MIIHGDLWNIHAGVVVKGKSRPILGYAPVTKEDAGFQCKPTFIDTQAATCSSLSVCSENGLTTTWYYLYSSSPFIGRAARPISYRQSPYSII